VAMGAPFKPASLRCARTPASCYFSTRWQRSGMAPITAGEAVFVSGSRIRGKRDPGSLSVPQIAAGLVGGCFCGRSMARASAIFGDWPRDLLARARLVFIETIEEFPTGLSEAKRVPEPHPAGQEFALALIRANFGSLSLLASL
jgi:hypothetical protein